MGGRAPQREVTWSLTRRGAGGALPTGTSRPQFTPLFRASLLGPMIQSLMSTSPSPEHPVPQSLSLFSVRPCTPTHRKGQAWSGGGVGTGAQRTWWLKTQLLGPLMAFRNVPAQHHHHPLQAASGSKPLLPSPGSPDKTSGFPRTQLPALD